MTWKHILGTESSVPGSLGQQFSTQQFVRIIKINQELVTSANSRVPTHYCHIKPVLCMSTLRFMRSSSMQSKNLPFYQFLQGECFIASSHWSSGWSFMETTAPGNGHESV